MTNKVKPKVSYSIGTLNHLSNEALNEIIRSNNYEKETQKLAIRILNARGSYE